MVQVFETRPVGDRRNPADVIWALETRCAALEERVSALEPPNTLPAPLTEDAIVAALKADPAMAGRVMAKVADTMWDMDRVTLSAAAKTALGSEAVSRGAYGALQSLAVALAAASYRG